MEETSQKKQLKEWMGLWRATDTAYTKFLKQWNLSLNAYLTLSWLNEHPNGSEPAQIADGVNIQRQLVAIILRDFETRKWISRKERREDHRRKCIKLTNEGRQTAETICDLIDNVESKTLDALNENELNLFIEASKRFHGALQTIILKQIEIADAK